MENIQSQTESYAIFMWPATAPTTQTVQSQTSSAVPSSVTSTVTTQSPKLETLSVSLSDAPSYFRPPPHPAIKPAAFT